MSDVRIPYKVNTSISTMRFVQQITHNKSQTKITKGLLHLLVGLNNGEVFKFSEDGLLQQTKKLTEEPITHITKNFATTKNKIYSMTNYKLMSEKYVCNGFYESTNSDEVYVAEVSHVMILSGRLEEKAQVNIPGEKLVWGDSGIVVTAGRTLNIGDLNGHTKCMSSLLLLLLFSCFNTMSLSSKCSIMYIDTLVFVVVSIFSDIIELSSTIDWLSTQ